MGTMVMRVTLNIVGVLLLVIGVIWILQGINVLPGSFMTGQIQWAVYGGVAVVAGLGALYKANLNRLEADIDPRNVASARSLERFGFKKEGHLRERWIVAGEVSDTGFYGLLQSDWRRTRAPENIASAR